ncbi:MAG: CBM20 domain-containing protein, partial [Planctomycetaceae bacterium]
MAVESDDVRVRIEVHLSEVAAAEAGNSDIYVAGNVPALGVWRPDGLKLHRESEGLFSGEFAAVAGSDIQFKVTRGTWRTVERDGRGGDVANRRIRVL